LDKLGCLCILPADQQPACWTLWSTLVQDFEALLEKIDQGLRALPATAQVPPPADESATGLLWRLSPYSGQPECWGTHTTLTMLPILQVVHGWCAAQVAKQQGQYLAKLVSAGIAPGRVPEGVAPFKYNHKGSLAYVGALPPPPLSGTHSSAAGSLPQSCLIDARCLLCGVAMLPLRFGHAALPGAGRDRAVLDVPGIGPISGLFAGIAWKASLVSLKCALVMHVSTVQGANDS
jgi:hypothetical protein